MKLSPIATAVWLLWLSLIVVKISFAYGSAAKAIARRFFRAAVVIGGVTAFRLFADNCPDSAHATSAFLAGVAIVAILADSVAAPATRVTPGAAALVSAAVITVAEIVLRSPHQCYEVAAPVLGVSSAVAVAWL